jgi:hypothetical protein
VLKPQSLQGSMQHQLTKMDAVLCCVTDSSWDAMRSVHLLLCHRGSALFHYERVIRHTFPFFPLPQIANFLTRRAEC